MKRNDYSQFLDSSNLVSSNKKAKRFKVPGILRKFFSIFLSPFRLFSKTRVGNLVLDTVTNKNILQKILFTIFIIIIYRGLASVPLPGINMEAYREVFGSSSTSEITYLLAIFTGGQLDSPSIVGLGLLAYINSSIILQLLTPAIPKLTELSKEGQQGMAVINQYTRYLTVLLSFVYSAGYIILISKTNLSSNGGELYLIDTPAGANLPSLMKIVFMATVLTAGSMLLVWLAEAISEYGIGNGSSIIITIGIISLMPALIKQDFGQLNLGNILDGLLQGSFNVLTEPQFLSILLVILGALLMVVMIVFVNESARNIQIKYASRGAGGESSSLPIKLTLTGVLPIIFASALMSLPQLFATLVNDVLASNIGQERAQEIVNWLENSFLYATVGDQAFIVDRNDLYYTIFYFILVVLFGVFYAFIQLKPEETAENLQKSGAFIPGIRPGKSTEKYISAVLLRISFAGSIFLGFVALLPIIARNFIVGYEGTNLALLSGIGGTSILIAVSVILETVRQYNSLRVSKNYERFIKN
ncbi:MAG: protein translocase subunit SecY [Candidatus Dojkabacteria bacterium]|nr:MAG: protein translocase subunit SecY [Candidatus Dojkabacteria bacterium]